MAPPAQWLHQRGAGAQVDTHLPLLGFGDGSLALFGPAPPPYRSPYRSPYCMEGGST